MLPPYLLQRHLSMPCFNQYGGLLLDILNILLSHVIISTMLKRGEFLKTRTA